MIIETREKEYYVISVLERTPEIFECREKDSTSSMKYTVLRLPIEKITAEMISFLMAQVNNESFVEFVDYTTDDAYLYLVMSRPEGNSFLEKVKNGELSFSERLLLGKKCLEHFFLSDFSDYFMHSAIRGGVFNINDALDVNFEFDLSDFTEFTDIDISNVASDIALTLGNLFRDELDRVAFAPMKELIDRLNSGSYSALMDIYEEYDAIFKEWNGKESYELKSHTKWDEFKEWLKKATEFLKSAVIYLILIAAFLYLVQSIYQLTRPYEQKTIFDKVGDVFIVNGEEEIDGN